MRYQKQYESTTTPACGLAIIIAILLALGALC